MSSIKDLIFSKSNDYSKIEKRFKKQTGKDLVTEKSTKSLKGLTQKISIIIPAYNSHKRIPILFKSLKKQKYKDFEIILIDDGSSPKLYETIKNRCGNLEIKYIRNSENKGRSYSRNVGLQIAKNKNVIFLDSDLFLPKYFISNLAIRLENTKNCLFITFKENTNKIKSIKRKPDIEEDWRKNVVIDSSFNNFIPLNLNEKENNRRGKIDLLKETDYLKNFGFGRSIGFWDLPSVVISHGIGCKKKRAINCGGFPEKLKGWGGEDIEFGSRMVACGEYVIPLPNCVCFHIKHKEKIEIKQLRKNLKKYFEDASQENDSCPSFPRHNIEKTGEYRNIQTFKTTDKPK